MVDYIEPISQMTLEEIGDAAYRAIKDILKERGYSCTGGSYGGKLYEMQFKRDTMDILGWEKPIKLQIILPYSVECEKSKPERSVKYSTIPAPDNSTNETDYLIIDELRDKS